MSANGISHLATKEAKQVAKLELAKLKREGYTLAADGSVVSGPDTNANFFRDRNDYDITQLPNPYNDNDVNPDETANTGGLVEGRPWVTP